jgi:hypothetical protein
MRGAPTSWGYRTAGDGIFVLDACRAPYGYGRVGHRRTHSVSEQGKSAARARGRAFVTGAAAYLLMSRHGAPPPTAEPAPGAPCVRPAVVTESHRLGRTPVRSRRPDRTLSSIITTGRRRRSPHSSPSAEAARRARSRPHRGAGVEPLQSAAESDLQRLPSDLPGRRNGEGPFRHTKQAGVTSLLRIPSRERLSFERSRI